MYRSVLLFSLILLALACSSPPPEPEPGPDYDVEIARAAQIGDPVLMREGGGQVTGSENAVFPSDWHHVQARRAVPLTNDDLTVRLGNSVATDELLPPEEFGVQVRGLGGELGSLVNLDDATNGLDNAGSGFLSDGDLRGRTENIVSLPEEQKRTWKRSALVPNLSRILVGVQEELPVDRMAVSVRVAGHRARVVLDLSFTNEHDRQLEGTFQLRLPAGASPFFLSFGEEEWRADEPIDPVPARSIAAIREVLGNSPKPMREARMARREKAARAYGETVRRSVDPALLEWAGGGIFSAKVFPLLPGKRHRIVVGYDLDLVADDGGRLLELDLPTELPERSVSVSVAGGVGFTANDVRSTGTDRELVFEDTDFPALTLRIEDAAPALLTDDEHFGISFTPDLPADPVAGSPTAVFLVDVSLSSNPERFRVFRELLPAILQANREQIRDFAVLFFNIETFWWKPGLVSNTPGGVARLVSFMDTLCLEGATDLGAALRAVRDTDFVPGGIDCFLLSDAAANWGAELPTDLPWPIYSYRTGIAGTDLRALNWLARESGGAVFTVAGENAVSAAATAHRNGPFTIESVSVPGCRDLLIAGRPVSIHSGQTLTVAGRGLPISGTALELVLLRNGLKRTVRLPLSQVIETPLAKRVYGEIAVSQLEGIGEPGHEPAAAYAGEFRVVGTSSSLVMLETEDDYERFEIDEEQNAALVEAELADPIVTAALSAARETKKRKAGFLAWLARLTDLPGVNLKLSAEVLAFIDGLPEEAFELPSAPISCRLRTIDQVCTGYRENLAARALTAEDLTVEADRRREQLGAADALKVLSSLVEDSPGSGAVLRDVAYSAMADGLFGPALEILRRVTYARPYEPETYRALARCYESTNRPELAMVYYELALAGQWTNRSGEFRRVLALDYLRLLRRIEEEQPAGALARLATDRRAALSSEFKIGTPGLVVVLTWNTDRSDMDLHVTDPNGEECHYQHTDTKIGGHLTADVTQGFGPEMFTLTDPIEGTYRIAVKNFSGDPNRMSLRTRVFVTIYEHWGTADERVTRRVVTLGTEKEVQPIAEVKVQ